MAKYEWFSRGSIPHVLLNINYDKNNNSIFNTTNIKNNSSINTRRKIKNYE